MFHNPLQNCLLLYRFFISCRRALKLWYCLATTAFKHTGILKCHACHGMWPLFCWVIRETRHILSILTKSRLRFLCISKISRLENLKISQLISFYSRRPYIAVMSPIREKKRHSITHKTHFWIYASVGGYLLFSHLSHSGDLFLWFCVLHRSSVHRALIYSFQEQLGQNTKFSDPRGRGFLCWGVPI